MVQGKILDNESKPILNCDFQDGDHTVRFPDRSLKDGYDAHIWRLGEDD